jgi:hypothetical protein
MGRTLNEQLKKEVIYLSNLGMTWQQVNETLGTNFGKSTIGNYRSSGCSINTDELVAMQDKFKDVVIGEPRRVFRRYNKTANVEITNEQAVSRQKKISKASTSSEKAIDKEVKEVVSVKLTEKEEKFMRYFNISLEEILETSEENIQEKRDLTLIAEEFERCFDIPITEDIIYSFQEKYAALRTRKVDALKVIIDKIHFVYRKTLSETHKWRFADNEQKDRVNKVVGHIINLIKSELDGTSYRAISEAQHKIVQFYKTLWNIDGELKPEVEQRIMELQARYNAFDIINKSIELIRNYNPELDFLSKINEALSK